MKPSFVFEDASDDEIEGDQTQDELVPSPSEYDDYSGLSDDLDLGMQHDDEDEQNIDAVNGSDDEVSDESNIVCFVWPSQVNHLIS